MQEALLFYVTMIAFGCMYIVLALLPQKQIKTKTDFFLAGRNLTVFKATCTLIATQLGAGLLLGTSQKAYEIGLYSLLFTGGICIGLILLGCGIAGRLRAMNIATTTEIFETKYNSPLLRKIASVLITFTLCGILVGNMVASKSLLVSMDFHSESFYLIFWMFIILYTMFGGLHAVVLTDLVQVLFITIVFMGFAAYTAWLYPPHFSWDALQSVQSHFTGQIPDLQSLIVLFLMPALFALFEQDLAQVFFASKTKKVAVTTAILTTIFIVTFGLIPVYLGIQAKVVGLTVSGVESPLLTLVKTLSNSFVLVMIASGILAAIASTADALLCAIGANLTQDFSLSFLRLSPLMESKATTFGAGVAVLALSYVMPTDIISILVKSYEVPVSCLLIPLLAAYFLPQVKYLAGVGGFIGGIMGYVVFKLWLVVPFQSLIVLLCSLIGYCVGHVLKKK